MKEPIFATEAEAEAWLNKNYGKEWTTSWSAGPIYADEHNTGIEIGYGKDRLHAMIVFAWSVYESWEAGKL